MRWLVPLCLVIAACGGDPKSPNDLDVGKVKGDAPAGAAGNKHGPSNELAARWPLGANPPRYLYADLGAIGSSELMKGIEPLLSISEIPEGPRACGKAVIKHAKELLVGESPENETFIVVRTEGDAIQTACAPLVSVGKTVEHVQGATLVQTGERETFAFLPGWVLVGNRQNVEAALASKGNGLPAIHLAPGEVVSGHGTKPGGLTFDGTLLMNKERLKAAVDLSGAPDDLPFIESMLEKGKKEGAAIGTSAKMTKEERAVFDHILQSWTFSRTDEKLHVQLDLMEDSFAQARDIGVMATLAVYGVRKYISNAKGAEARNTLGQMAKDVAVWYEGEEMGPGGTLIGPGTKKLFSIPPTPKTVPKGVKYQSQRSDWKPWEKLRFEMDAPQYFQYEMRAAKDGQSADLIARGDLNGDGKTSEFLLHVTIEQGNIRIAPSIKETNPEE